LRFGVKTSTQTWSLEFAANDKNILKKGMYQNVTRLDWPTPNLTISYRDKSSSRGCNKTSGWFEVKEVSFSEDKSELVSFAADFEFYCDNQKLPTKGEFRYNASLNDDSMCQQTVDNLSTQINVLTSKVRSLDQRNETLTKVNQAYRGRIQQLYKRLRNARSHRQRR
jgi:hypothetical protein